MLMNGNSIYAVMVTYHPGDEVLGNVRALLEQVDHVVVVDNTPTEKAAAALDEISGWDRCTVIFNRENLGIAAALNIGIRFALTHGAGWILTSDQDSRVQENYVEEMLRCHAESSKKATIGMVCPRYVDDRVGGEIPMNKNSSGEIVGCWTSGSMAPAEVYKIVGLYEEPLFIDFVDHEYCMRMRSQGYQIAQCRRAVLKHSLGRITPRRFFRGIMLVTNHSAGRRYYINRNRLVLIKRYFRHDREWAMIEAKGLIADSIAVLRFEKDKAAKFNSMARALFDGLFNRLGQRVPL